MPFKDRHNNNDGDDAAMPSPPQAAQSRSAAIKKRQNGEKWPTAVDRNESTGWSDQPQLKHFILMVKRHNPMGYHGLSKLSYLKHTIYSVHYSHEQ